MKQQEIDKKQDELLVQLERLADIKSNKISQEIIDRAQTIGIDLNVNFIIESGYDLRTACFDRRYANKMGSIILDKLCTIDEQFASHIEKTDRTPKFPLHPAKLNLIKACYFIKFNFNVNTFNEYWPNIKMYVSLYLFYMKFIKTAFFCLFRSLNQKMECRRTKLSESTINKIKYQQVSIKPL